MQALPHYYRVTGAGAASGDVELTAAGLTPLLSASPVEFGGPGGKWSPESLLVGAVADCFILTFRAIAAASRLSWISLACDATGTLDRVDGALQFTRFDLVAHLVVPPGADAARARLLLDKAERNCLISRSVKATMVLEATVEMAQAEPGSVAVEAKTT